MAGLVNYDIYEDSTEETEQIDEKKDAVVSSKKMEDEWEDFERLISEKKVENDDEKKKATTYLPTVSSDKNGEERLKNLKFDVGNFVNHNETTRYSQDGKVIKENTSEDKEKDKVEKSKNEDKKDKYSPGDKRKRSRSHSKSRRHKRSSSSSSSSPDSRHKHHHHHHKRSKRSRSPRHHHHRRRRHHHSRRSSSSRSPSRDRGGRNLTRAVLSSRHKRMLMMNREASMKTQVTNKLVEAMIAPSMKSGTTLPKVFGDINVETLKEQLKDVYGKTLDQIQIDESKLLKANEKKSALPLLQTNNNQPISTSINSTPQDVLSQTMAAMHAKVQELTGVAIPKYYKPAAVNPLKYADQLKKRKLLWSKDKTQAADTSTSGGTSKWAGTTLLADDSGKMSAKFSKLMGIKQPQTGVNVDEEKKKREELFHNLESEYEQARHTTHSYRGVGLGFASQHMP